jgi:hypothetical protein
MLIWVKREAIYFCARDCTGSISLIWFKKFVFLRIDKWRKKKRFHVSLPTRLPRPPIGESASVKADRMSGTPGQSHRRLHLPQRPRAAVQGKHNGLLLSFNKESTLDARASSDAGISMPRAFAVCASNLLGFCAGKSAGFAPRKILST